MKCPACGQKDTKVIDSRVVDDAMVIRRRRECEQCSFRFSTHEEVEILNLMVEKRDGAKEPYHRKKVEAGIKKALEKRPLAGNDIKRLIYVIEKDVQLLGNSNQGKISTTAIGEIVMKALKKKDLVAYIRFASVYKSFDDISSFKKELSEVS